jgi:hypothetical protein
VLGFIVLLFAIMAVLYFQTATAEKIIYEENPM